jgi:hypothetical protein
VNVLRAMVADRRSRQRGSVLSGLLIIVAMLAILIGALMTELSSSFLLSRTLSVRVQREATVNSAMELGIHSLQARSVPAVCATDTSGPYPLSSKVNGIWATVTRATCSAIVADQTANLATGNYPLDGIRDSYRNAYLVADSLGRLRSYVFGQASPSWTVALGGSPSGPATTTSRSLMVPVNKSASDCNGHCVAFYDFGGGTPSFRCNLRASALVTAGAAVEVPVGGRSRFPNYVFFATPNGVLYVYDPTSSGCPMLATASAGGGIAGPLLVFAGTRSGSTTSDDIFAVVTDSTRTRLTHWIYSEAPGDCQGQCDGGGQGTTISLTQAPNPITIPIGATAIGYDTSANAPATNLPLDLVIAAAGGRIATARISVAISGQRMTYSEANLVNASLGVPLARAPYWCHCGPDLIGVGSTNGRLMLLSTGLAIVHQYTGSAPINTTPIADASGDWYFGADDGNVYDVEVAGANVQALFLAAKFSPGTGAIRSSPIENACGSARCVYFGYGAAGTYLVLIGDTRQIDMQACVTSASGSSTCSANPQLWAQVTVGKGASGGHGVSVQGWSYYSP